MSKVGVIGAAGDLGSQLTKRLIEYGVEVVLSDPSLTHSASLQDVLTQCDIIHICAPLEKIGDVSQAPNNAIFVLHDSVMDYSRSFSRDRLRDNAAVVHMLMNDHQSVVVASDAAHSDEINDQMKSVGYQPQLMTVDEHDLLMARSQAPLALLLRTLIPYLYEKEGEGLLTASGQLLADTLKSREIMWTPATITSILRNPQLPHLIDDMQATLTKVGYNDSNE